MKAQSVGISVGWIKVLLFGLILVALYYSSFSWLVLKDWQREDYSHGWLIPLVILYLLWEKRPALQAIAAKPSWLGLAVLLPGLFLYWLGELAGEFFTQYLSFTLIIIGLCWLLLGWEKLKTLLFALLFTVAMFPPPNFLHDKITFQLKLISSELGVRILHLAGMSAYRQGNIIDLGFTQLQVVDACSGLRYLFPILIMAILFAYLYKDRLWKKIVLILSVVPLTLAVNALRIAGTGILYKFWGAEVAEGFFHEFAGVIVFMTGLTALLFEVWLLSGFRSIRSWGLSTGGGTAGRSVQASDGVQTARPAESVFAIGHLFTPPQFVVALSLLLAMLAAGQFIDFREKIPPSKPFSSFPLKIASWQGSRGLLGQNIIDTLDLSDYTMMDYRQADGRTVNFYIAYYQSQSKGESIHSPETCLPGSGWRFEKSGMVKLPVAWGKYSELPVNSAVMSQGENRQLVYFWFPLRDRVVTNAFALKWFNFWDALTRQRTDGALVRVITPVYPGEELKDGNERLLQFIRDMSPVLAEYLPD